ncbi:hypothetical protein BDV28DRAFT_144631 [Aspergillus coremiiformis]|uniref:Uncharacterized protein n=1 Tax=Aspergillus coremiiformis TaxID=138285 RepID=A0A5N6ZIC0_9EURO|nr:hypothetical protein BDV28DRAFT_144631 [Aspergillus coremiiformis]
MDEKGDSLNDTSPASDWLFLTILEIRRVIAFIFENNDVKGVVTADGKSCVPSKQSSALAQVWHNSWISKPSSVRQHWTLAQIQRKSEERALYKNLPVIFNLEKGLFFEPDDEHGEVNSCNDHPRYTNVA